MIDHRLGQIAEDGSLKLPQRLFPMLIANAQSGKPIARMAAVVRSWLALMATMPSRDSANAWFAEWAKAGADTTVAAASAKVPAQVNRRSLSGFRPRDDRATRPRRPTPAGPG